MPGVFGMGLLHGGVLAQRLTAWVGLANIRSFRIRFTGQVWPGDLLSFGGRVTGVREAGGHQVADLELVVTRQTGEPAIKGSAVVQVAR
ncbi:MaoC-like dehydratase [Mycobacteroides abscessus subsp. abscessus]|nr:MaoC-like dehydratase [Mycobacteroides abscessus subsp. abscessus]